MLTLFGFKRSGSAAVELALEVANIPYRIIEAATWEPSTQMDALRKVNPLAQIPTLVFPDGSIMTESVAILIHLGLQAPAGLLLPEDEAARAQAIRGLVFIAANCYSAISISDYPERWTSDPSEAALNALRAGTRARLHANWNIFADTFPARPFLSGDKPGALDFLAAVVTRWSGTRAHLQADRPAFHETLQRIEADERVAPVFRRHWET